MDVVMDELDKEVTKVKKLVMEVNEDLVLVFIHCDGQCDGRYFGKASACRTMDLAVVLSTPYTQTSTKPRF